MKTLVLVDGSSYLYRAFHALPDLRTRTNEPTGAIYGVLNMLRRIYKDYAPDYSACVFDAKGKTFRDALYPEYKATRRAMPDDLGAQIEPLCEAIRAMGWPLLTVEGVEADDVIGTLAREAERAGARIVISTGDKDLAQLVTLNVTVVNTMSNEVLDDAGVEEKFGVPPRLIVDYLTILGDTIDNVPGVPKAGPKTSVKWLTQYGSLDALIANAAEIPGMAGENLRQSVAWLPRARELIAIKCDVALPVRFTDLAPEAPNYPKLAELFERFEFKSWRRELPEPAITEAHGMVSVRSPREYATVLTQDELLKWLSQLQSAPLVSVDTETTGLDPINARLVGISLCVEPNRAAYVPLAHRYPGAPSQLEPEWVLRQLKPWLEDSGRKKVGRNVKYDKHILANHSVKLAGIEHDICLQSYVLASHKPHDLDNLAERYLNLRTIHYEDIAGRGAAQIPFSEVSVERATEYSAEYADVALQLHQCLYARIAADEKLNYIYRTIEIPLTEVLFAMERHGVLLDVRLLEAHSRELGTKLIELECEAHRAAESPFNLGSPKQIQEILFERLGLPVIKKTPGGAPSTDEDVLQQLALDYPLPRLILECRALSKLKSTYTDKLPRMVNLATGRVHTNYGQTVAVTGRLASTDPNLQNIPVRTPEGRRIREAFIAPPGFRIVSADYSQIELRIMAHLSQDASLVKAFREDGDIHRATAAEVFGVSLQDVTAEQRRHVKAINFGLMYGMSSFGLAAQLGIDRHAAQQYMERYFTRYPGVAAYMERTRETARDQGYVETVFGRRLWLPEIKGASGPRRQAAERAAINAPMQGSAADLIKLAMIAVHEWLETNRMYTKLIMQVHDELVLEAPEAELEAVQAELPRLMGGVANLDVPLVVDVGSGPNWEQAH
jgi:DNA polymerase I